VDPFLGRKNERSHCDGQGKKMLIIGGEAKELDAIQHIREKKYDVAKERLSGNGRSYRHGIGERRNRDRVGGEEEGPVLSKGISYIAWAAIPGITLGKTQ